MSQFEEYRGVIRHQLIRGLVGSKRGFFNFGILLIVRAEREVLSSLSLAHSLSLKVASSQTLSAVNVC